MIRKKIHLFEKYIKELLYLYMLLLNLLINNYIIKILNYRKLNTN